MQTGVAERPFTLRLQRWDDDCVLAGIAPPADVELACADSATVELAAFDATTGELLGNLEPVWLPAGDPAADVVLFDLRPLPDGRLATVVPAGAGELLVALPGYAPRHLPLTTRAGEHADLGRVLLERER